MRLIGLAIAAVAWQGCSCEKKKDAESASAAVDEVGEIVATVDPSAGAGSSTTPPAAVADSDDDDGLALTRLTPEQISNAFATNGNFGAGKGELRELNQQTGQVFDYLLFLYGVPLGGIDFVNASVRDPSTKAQTLLVARNIAWSLGQAIVWKELNLAAGKRVVFSKCDPGTDRPYFADWDDGKNAEERGEVAAGEAAWAEQVAELWWRFYSRPPTPAELDAVKTMFVATLKSQGWPPAGWVALLYAVFSSQEFWHI